MPIENLVFSGGGVKCIAMAGAVRMLEKKGVLKNIKRIIGTSGGSFFALLLAVKFTSLEIIKIIKDQETTEAISDNDVFTNIKRLTFNFGYYPFKEILSNRIYEILLDKGIHPKITFEQIYNQYDIDLTVTATLLNSHNTVYINKDTFPNLSVITAIQASTAIPLVFEPVKIDDDILIDGGITDNYPLYYYKNKGIDPDFKNTIGIVPFSDEDLKPYHRINDIFEYIESLTKALTNDKFVFTDSVAKDKTLIIYTKHIKSTDFNISDTEKDALMGRGYRCTKSQLNKLGIKEKMD